MIFWPGLRRHPRPGFRQRLAASLSGMTFWTAAAKRSGDTALDETNPASNAGDTDRKAGAKSGGEVGPLRCNGPARVQRAESVDGQRAPETGLALGPKARDVTARPGGPGQAGQRTQGLKGRHT